MALSLTLAAAAFAPPRSHLPLRRTRCLLTMQSENREPPHNVLGGSRFSDCIVSAQRVRGRCERGGAKAAAASVSERAIVCVVGRWQPAALRRRNGRIA